MILPGASIARDLLDLAELPYPAGDALTIVGADPVVRTPYKVGSAAAAAQGAIGVAISELWGMHGHRGQQIRVDLRAAALALFVYKYSFLNGKAFHEIDPYDSSSLFYPVKDGRWIKLNTKYPHHRAITLQVLGGLADMETAARATSTWDGLALEDALHAAGGCAGLVRSAQEWAQHPQSSAVAAQPLLEIERIGDAPAETLGQGERPLAGLRVLDLTRVVAGPVCGRTFAEHGADVLKINAAHLPDSGIGELDSGLGKLSAQVDLRSNEGLETVRGLLREADVFVQSYRPGALAARGLGPADAARLRPGIVYVELSAWGTSGPWSMRRGYDPLVQSVSGMIAVPRDGSRPSAMPVAAIDYLTGYLMAFGALVALHHRARIGGSWVVRTSLARVGQWLAGLGVLEASEVARVAEPSPDEIARLSMETDSPAGRVRHLKPVVELSETPPFWARPPVPLGYHPPVWPA